MSWQAIDTAEEKAGYVLGYTAENNRGMFVMMWEEGWTYGWVDDHGHHVWPTHWQPLPEPPK